jgi:hypothetical protein
LSYYYKLRLLTALGILNAAARPSLTFELKSDLLLHNRLRKYRGFQGMLDSNWVPEADLLALHQVINISSDSLKSATASGLDSFTAIADSGCSLTCTNSKEDFLSGTMKELTKPITLGGIAGGLEVKHHGIVSWETLDDFGNIVSLQTKAYLQEHLPCQLLSPQAFLKHSTHKLNDHFPIYSDKAGLHQDGSTVLTLPLNSSFLPSLTLFWNGTAQALLNALYNTLVGDSNANLSPWTKHWLCWHYGLGHLGFEHARQLGVGGYLDTKALGLTKAELLNPPKCAACCYGKQARKPDHINTKAQHPSTKGQLLKGQLQPDERIFTDQLESRVWGRLLTTTGREPDCNEYCGSSIFYDDASGFIHVEHQVHLSATDTIMAKNSFERFAKDNGVSIKSYHTDNGVYKSEAFQQALIECTQTVQFSGVGAKWQKRRSSPWGTPRTYFVTSGIS